MGIETEIKFVVDDMAALSQRLSEIGFHLLTPRAFESNTLYDTPDRQMRSRTEILRIRGYNGHWTVTHKRPPAVETGLNAAGDPHKHRIEFETLVGDGTQMAEIFLSLGLVPAFRYEKWRTEWSDGEGHCVLDETPIGNFAELEGPPEWIDRTASHLHLPREKYITLSYGRLFELWREEHNSSSNDLTFEAIGSQHENGTAIMGHRKET
jgi:adenylate cyclase class 2